MGGCERNTSTISNRLQGISGDLEMLRGKQAELRGAGAGSDITGPIQQQIDAMEAESKGLSDTIQNSPIGQMQDQLDCTCVIVRRWT